VRDIERRKVSLWSGLCGDAWPDRWDVCMERPLRQSRESARRSAVPRALVPARPASFNPLLYQMSYLAW